MTSTTPTGPDKPSATATGGPDDGPSGPHRDASDNPGEPGEKGGTPRGWRLREAVRRLAVRDLGVFAVYLAIAAYVTYQLWPPATRVLTGNPGDHFLEQWFLAHGTRFWAGDFSLVTPLMNSPDGINLMANASLILPGVLLAPVTAAFGAAVSFTVLAAGNMAATATGWYLIFSRPMGASRPAAFLGGLLCGFAPGLISQSTSHLHVACQWLVPPIVWCVIRLFRGARPVPTGLLLGLLVTLQLFSGEEVLFLTAVGVGVFAVSYAVAARSTPRQPVLVGLGVAAATAGTLLAYPLWVQFKGAQSIPGGLFDPGYFHADLAALAAFSPQSLAGSPANSNLAQDASEYTSFFGWPLLAAAAVVAVWRWREPLVRAATVTAVAMLWLSLGPQITFAGESTGFPGPYMFLVGLPVLEGALPTRFALAAVPPLAVIVVLAVERLTALVPTHVRMLPPVTAACLLIPIMPAPLAASDHAPVPRFITAGHWRECVRPGGVLVPVPLPTPLEADTLGWAAAADDRFAVPQGYFIGPYGANGSGSMGVYAQPTAQLLEDVQKTGQVPVIGDEQRAGAQADVTHWKATCIALSAAHPQADVLKQTLDGLYGPSSQIADAWVWRVTP